MDLSYQSTSDHSAIVKPKISLPALQNLHRIEHRHLLRLPLFIVIYLLSVGAIELQLQMSWNWIFYVPFYLLAAAALHGISLFVHEGVHGVLFQNEVANRAVSILCAVPVLQNFSAYKILHLQHHSNLGKQGDPDHYRNYTSWTNLEFLMHWSRLIIGYPIYLIMIPVLGWQQAQSHDRFWIAFEIMIELIIGISLVILLPNHLLLHGWLIPMGFINLMVNIRGMSQHTLLEHECDPIRGTRTLLTNPITRFFMCNENYHLEHHLYPGVPWYHLPKLHQAVKAELRDRGAHYLPSYFAFIREFLMANVQKKSTGSISLENL